MDTWLADLTAHVDPYMNQHQVPGMAVAVSEQGQTLLAHGFGLRDQAKGLPVTPETVFGVASITKSFAAMAVMQLQDQGRLAVTDRVQKWLPEFRGPQEEWLKAITLHHLMTHSSGLPGMLAVFHARAGSIRNDPNRHRMGLPADLDQIRPIRTYQELMALMAETDYQPLGAPGTVFNYSNEGFALLQGVIERASDMPFLDYMSERILRPLGMERSAFRTADLEQLDPVTELYASQAVGGKLEVFHAPGWWDVGEIYTNGSLKSTVADLLRYLEVYRCGGVAAGHRILSAEAVRQMTTPHITMPTGRQYGYGLEVQTGYHGVTLVGHGGAIKGVSAHMLLALEPGVAAIALANLSGLATDAITLGAINRRLGLPWETPRQEFVRHEVAAAALAEFQGSYHSVEGSRAEVRLQEGALWLETGGLPFELRPVGADGFVVESTGAPIRFLRDGQGGVNGLFMGVRVLPRV